jgi:integrase/recombinase XerC
MDIALAADRFALQLRANGRSPHTLGQYQRHTAALRGWLLATSRPPTVAALDHTTVAEFLVSPAATHRPDGSRKRPTSVNALRTSLRCFLRYLHLAGLTPADPGRLVQRAVVGEPVPKGLPKDDQARLIAALEAGRGPEDRRDRALFLTLLRTGARLGSILAADAEDLDLVAGELLLRTTKRGRPQRLFLPPEVVQALAEHLGTRTAGPLFPAKDPTRPITARHAQRRLQAWLSSAACRPASPHALRHTFALGLYRETRDLLLVRRALGHQSLASTLRYADATDDDLRAVIQRA